MDNNNCHQPDEFQNIWRQVQPQLIKECKFELIINKDESLKKCIFNMLQIYLDGRLFTVDNLLSDKIAI